MTTPSPGDSAQAVSPLRLALAEAINRHGAENESDTPDYILAEYLTDCMTAFDRAVNTRERWYGRFAAKDGER